MQYVREDGSGVSPGREGFNNEFDEVDNFRSAGHEPCFGSGLGCVCTADLATDTDARPAGRLGPGWTAARCAKWTDSPARYCGAGPGPECAPGGGPGSAPL